VKAFLSFAFCNACSFLASSNEIRASISARASLRPSSTADCRDNSVIAGGVYVE